MKLVLGAPALALLTISQASLAQTFTVNRAQDDSVAWTGTLSGQTTDPNTGFTVQFADFSPLDDSGEYYLAMPGVGKSVKFRIGTDVYDGELATVMLGFYGWRSGIPIDFTHHGVHYQHEAGHLNDALLDYVDGQIGVKKDGVGGWYDAGDYGKYIPTAAESVNSMLAAWELFSDKLQHLSLPFLPEHGSGLPDYLSEIKWELDWMLKMAYSDGSGRVHHKINSPSFPGFVQPSGDPTTRYFSGYSTGATAQFVASMAKAARAFAPYDGVTNGYSQTLLKAAKDSYAYLQANPATVQYDAKVLAAGSYQKKDIDDRLWAAAEYWEATGEEAALADLETRMGTAPSFVPNFDWDTTTNFGLLTYALSKREGRNPALVTKISQGLQNVADLLVATGAASGYGRDYDQYYWGTNGVIARTCLLLQSANALNPNRTYLDACADQIGFLYGRNQYNRSQVTGAGIAPPFHPHHRPSGSDQVDDPYPGLVVGGGQSATGWLDLQGNYQTNEVAINWNAALAFALAGFIQGEGATASLGIGPTSPADCGIRLNSIGYVPGRAKVATIQSVCELPSTFKCSVGQTTMGGDTSGPPSMIDDMEDGDLDVLSRDGRRGTWTAFDDGSGGTRTDVEVKPAERSGSDKAACISGNGFSTWGGGTRFWLADDGTKPGLYDASRYTGLTFWARGLPTQFRVMLVDEYSEPAGNKCTGCYDHFNFTFTPSAEWKKYTFKWSSAQQIGFGDTQPNVCPSALFGIQFQWLANDDFDLCVDDIAFTTAAGTPADADDGGKIDGGAKSDSTGHADASSQKESEPKSESSSESESDSEEDSPQAGNSGGCSCRMGGDAPTVLGWGFSALVGGGLAVVLRRRGRRARSR